MHRILPDPSVHSSTLPLDIARKSDVYGKQSSHAAPLSWGPELSRPESLLNFSPSHAALRQMPLNSPPSVRSEAPVIHFAAGDTK
jgi:hypothetical protein